METQDLIPPGIIVTSLNSLSFSNISESQYLKRKLNFFTMLSLMRLDIIFITNRVEQLAGWDLVHAVSLLFWLKQHIEYYRHYTMLWEYHQR